MKIAIDCRMTGKSGIGSYLDSLLPYFINEYDCLLLGNKENIEKKFSLSINSSSKKTTILDCNIKTFSVKETLFFPKSLTNLINKCDLYYSPYCNVPSKIKIPVFTTIHDIVFLDIFGIASKIGTFVRKLFYLRAIYRSKIIFTVSEFSKSRIQEKLKCKKQIIVTYNAVPPYITKKSDDENFQKDDFSILFVGNIKKHKGLKILIDAFKKLICDIPQAKLIIVGDSQNFRTEDNEIFTEIKTLPKNSVIFTGKISDEKLKKYYEKSTVLVQPSYYEGFGMPPLEALYCKTNVIISDIPVFKEIYKNFPVTFFECGNSNDLFTKIKNCLETSENSKLNINIQDIYSFEKTFSIIKNTFKEFL